MMKPLMVVCVLALGLVPAVFAGPNVETTPTSTPGPTSTPAPTSTSGLPQGCRDGDPLANVYQPSRLKVLAPCVQATGVVKVVYHEPDGDYHVNITVDPPFRSLLNEGDMIDARGALITEIVPHDQASVPVPAVGTHVRVVGPWVDDLQHGHNEIHPVWVMQPTTQVTPPPPPSVVASGQHADNPVCGARPSARRTHALIQAVVVCPAPVKDYLQATITAYARPGATCTTKVVYAPGYRAASGYLRLVRTVHSDGVATWHWVPETPGLGRARATVTCQAGRMRQSMTRTFILAPGTPPED